MGEYKLKSGYNPDFSGIKSQINEISYRHCNQRQQHDPAAELCGGADDLDNEK